MDTFLSNNLVSKPVAKDPSPVLSVMILAFPFRLNKFPLAPLLYLEDLIFMFNNLSARKFNQISLITFLPCGLQKTEFRLLIKLVLCQYHIILLNSSSFVLKSVRLILLDRHHFDNILRVFDGWANFPFTTSEAKHDRKKG